MISIITINRNNHKGLEKTIQSVVAQSYQNIQFIVIDGKSNDDSINVIQDNAPHINYWISEKDSGIYDAMNKGLAIATNEFVFFLNSGDCFYDSEVLEKAVGKFQNMDIIYGDIVLGPDKKRIYYPITIDLPYLNFYSLPHQGTFIRRNCFEVAGNYDSSKRIVSDWAWFLKSYYTHNFKFSKIDIIISHCEDNGVSLNSNNEFIINSERNEIRNELFPNSVITLLNTNAILQDKLINIEKHPFSYFYNRIKNKVINLICLKRNIC